MFLWDEVKEVKGYKPRRKRKVLLDQLAWDQFRHDAGVKVRKGEEVQGWLQPGPASLLARTQGNLGGVYGPSGGMFWSLDWPVQMRREPGYWRCCVVCRDEIYPGQCSVHPALRDDWGKVDCRADWSQAHHVACVEPAQWALWLGHPRAANRRTMPVRPRATAEVIQLHLDLGILTLAEGVEVDEAVAAIRAGR